MYEKVLVIAGSRKATKAMYKYTDAIVDRAIENNWMIYVGDNPNGIDRQVLKSCNRKGYKDITVISVAGENRSLRAEYDGEKPGNQYRYEEYHARDMEMLRLADIGIFIWDGKSKGTKAGFDFMVQLGKEAHLANFFLGCVEMQSVDAAPEPQPVMEKMI